MSSLLQSSTVQIIPFISLLHQLYIRTITMIILIVMLHCLLCIVVSHIILQRLLLHIYTIAVYMLQVMMIPSAHKPKP